MSLRDRETTHPAAGQGLPCPIARIMTLLDPDDRATLDEWMAQPPGMKGRRSDRMIADDLTAETGESIGDYQVGPHRRGACRCFRGVPKS